MKQKVKPYGTITTVDKKYFLLTPQPTPKDSCWNDGTYQFYVATYMSEPLTIITNNFTIEYRSDIGPIELAGTHEVVTPVNVVEPADELYPMDEEEHYYTHLEEHLV